jgi:hypothetical protein
MRDYAGGVLWWWMVAIAVVMENCRRKRSHAGPSSAPTINLSLLHPFVASNSVTCAACSGLLRLWAASEVNLVLANSGVCSAIAA